MYEGWLNYGGHELINNSRVYAYAAALGIGDVKCGPCPTLPRAIGDAPYIDPVTDDAPWYDPAVPESAGFAGVLGLEEVGMADGISSQSSTDLPAGGALLGPLRRRAKEIQFRVALLATDDCALSYGRSWLAAALRGSSCTGPCSGSDLCFFTCCPPDCPPPDEGEPDLCGVPYYRTMINLGVMSGPTRRSLRKWQGGMLSEVDFTFKPTIPYIWREPTLLATGPTGGQQLPAYSDPGVPPECTETADCVKDPLCPQPLPPVLPPPAIDLCYPTTPFTARRWVVDLSAVGQPVWHERVPYIRINPGSLALRRLTLRWYINPLNRDCAEQLDPCAACAEVQVPYLPAHSWFTLDGRTEQATVDCPGGPGLTIAYPPIYGRAGSPFTWPAFTCDVPMCLEIIALDSSVAPDARWEISTVVREEAA